MITEENILKIKEIKTEKKVLDFLNKKHITYEDKTQEFGYFNISIPTDSGKLRVYKYKKQLIFQGWTKYKVKKVIKEIPICYGCTKKVETLEYQEV